MATDSGHARRARWRATSTLLLAAQLLTLGHLLAVRHAICPEHGEAIHSESSHEAQAMPATHEDATAHPTLGRGAPLAEHDHDHCLARANTRQRFALWLVPDVMSGSPLVAATLSARLAVRIAPPVAVLLLAPKNSPPAA
jgi:hypothetical protein